MRRKRARKNEAAPASLNKFASLARLELVQRECRPLSQPADDFLPVPHSRSATTTACRVMHRKPATSARARAAGGA